jgi:sugar phosphate permease
MVERSLTSKKASVLLLAVLFITYAFICLTKNCFSSAMVFIVSEGILTKFQTGVISAAFYTVYAILQIVGGVITDKWHPERFITVGLIGASLSNLVIFFNQNYTVMLVSWIFNAMIQFAVWPATFKLVSTMLVKEMRSNSLFLITFGNPFGVVFSYAVAALVGTSWQYNFLVSSVGLVIIAIVWEITVKSISPYVKETEIEAPKTEKSEENATRISLFKLIFSSGLILFTALSFIRTMFDLGIKSMSATMINESYTDVSPTMSTWLTIIVLICGAVGPCIARIIYPRFIKNEAIAAALFFFAAAPLAALTLLVGKIHYVALVIILALIVMLMSGCSIFTTSYAAAKFNKWGKGATVAGILNCTASFGVVGANLIFTAIAEGAGWFGTAVVWVIMMAVSILITLTLIPIWSAFLKNTR